MPEYLVDANILIHVFKGDQDLSVTIDSLDFAIDTTVYVEVIQGAKNKNEVRKIERELEMYTFIPFNEAISRRTIELIRKYSKSHGLMYADAVIAATCLVYNLTLVTFNRKDFQFVSGLNLFFP